MEICAFLGLVGHYRPYIKGIVWIAQPLNEHLAWEGASRKSEWVSLSEDGLEAFQALKQACTSSSILAFAGYTKDFLLKTDTAYGSWALTAHEKNYHSTNLEFMAIMEHFKEYLLYQPY